MRDHDAWFYYTSAEENAREKDYEERINEPSMFDDLRFQIIKCMLQEFPGLRENVRRWARKEEDLRSGVKGLGFSGALDAACFKGRGGG